MFHGKNVKISKETVVLINKLFLSKKYELTDHAILRMSERNISDFDVYECGCYGKAIECQFHGRDFKVLLHKIINSRQIYIVTTVDEPSTVITVCLMLEQLWDDMGKLGFKRK